MTITMNIEKDIFVHLASSTQGVFPPVCILQHRTCLLQTSETQPNDAPEYGAYLQ